MVLICFHIAHVSQGWGSRIIFWKFHQNVWFLMWPFHTCLIFDVTVLHLFRMFYDLWLYFETSCIIWHQFPTQPTESFSTSPNIFACYAWQHILTLDEKSKWNEQAESVQISGRPMGLFFFYRNRHHYGWVSMSTGERWSPCLPTGLRRSESVRVGPSVGTGDAPPPFLT